MKTLTHAKHRKLSLPEPTEDAEQIALFQWADLFSQRFPELKMLLHVPNGGKRGKAEAGRFKAMGVKSGVPDIFLPIPRGKAHGLWIEMKRVRSGHLTPKQQEWIELLTSQGYIAHVCYGWEQASKVITAYLTEN